MKKPFFIIALIATLLCMEAAANPFSSKTQTAKIKNPQKISEIIVFKGFAVIGERRFGLVQIGQSDFEVLEGDEIKGIRIKKVGDDRLDYSVNNENRHILLNSD